MNVKEIIEGLEPKKEMGDFRVGDLVRVHVKIHEGEKTRVQVFEGTIIKKRRNGPGSSFTVRKVSYGIGVERIFPTQSSIVERIEVLQRGKIRRAKLFYLRKRHGKESQIEAVDDRTEEEAASSKKKAAARVESGTVELQQS